MLTKPLVIAGTFTVEPLEKYLTFIANILQRPLETRFAPYNQIFQELLDPNSLSFKNHEGINFFLYRFEDLFYHEDSTEEQIKKIDQYGRELADALRSFSERGCPPSFILRCPSSPETKSHETIQTAILQSEKLIETTLSGLSNIHYLSQDELEMLYPVADYYDSSLEQVGHMPYTKEEYCALALYMMRKWHVLHLKPYKVIALDADNTLWKGVCGELGPTGVQVTSSYKALQEFMFKQMQEGLLLCLCSKNTESDVWDVFSLNSGMMLKQENFVGWRINWEPKSINLIDLANELKLDPNSFIFLDDNPVETAEVQASCPTIMAVTLPTNEEMIPAFLNNLWIFDRLHITEEDRLRTLLYQQEKERSQFTKSHVNMRDFIESLNLNITITSIDDSQFSRVAQLTQRTNQFNTTTIRRSEIELKKFLEDPLNAIYTITVSDRFGSYGLVGVLFTSQRGEELWVDSILLSCRVLGRGVEHRMVAFLGEKAEEANLKQVTIPYKKTKRNEPVKNFLINILEDRQETDEEEINFQINTDKACHTSYEPNAESPIDIKEEAKEKSKKEEGDNAETLAKGYYTLAANYSQPKAILHDIEESESRKAVTDLSLSHFIKERLANLLKVDPASLDDEVGFFDQGLDSFGAVELHRQLENAFKEKCIISPTAVFDYPSIASLSGYLSDLLHKKTEKAINVESKAFYSEPIAIIGMSCRFPGSSTSPEAFWETISQGRDEMAPIPEDRWDREFYYDPNPDAPGKMNVKEGGFVKNVDQFDPAFFNISPREAESMDPQQRILLEVAVEALERANINLHALRGSTTGVFIGSSTLDYGDMILREGGVEAATTYFATGNALSAISGRIAYVFGLNGPVVTLDTACSSSLVAIHEACDNLRLGECSLAIAGGVSLMLTPNSHIILSKAHMLAPDGRCKTFDASANGYARSEGCGVIILKRLSDALNDNDNVLAIIRGSATNHVGPSSGFTVPNGIAQEALYKTALIQAGAAPFEVDYIEAHGTGTSLGDPIEARALGRIYGTDRPPNHPLTIGSVKTNIGHLEPAAGVAGLMKVVLMLMHEQIPPNLHFHALNPMIDLASIPAEVPTILQEWQRFDGKKRLAGVSSFGFAGTNAHVILEEAPTRKPRTPIARPSHILTLSARSKQALEVLRHLFIQFLEDNPSIPLADIAYSANAGRAHYEYRLAVQAKNHAEAIQNLRNAPISLSQRNPKIENIDESTLYANTGVEQYELLIQLYQQGASLNWEVVDKPYAANKVILPTYPFQRGRFWSKIIDHKDVTHFIAQIKQPLEIAIHETPVGILLQSYLSANHPYYISQHQIYHTPVIAGATYISAIIAFIRHAYPDSIYEIEEIEFLKPLLIKNETCLFQALVSPAEGERQHVEFFSRSENEEKKEWVKHVSLWIKQSEGISLNALGSLEELLARCPHYFSKKQIYSYFEDLEFSYGMHFSWLEELYVGHNECIAKLRPPLEEEINFPSLNPGLIDSCFQAVFGRMIARNEKQGVLVPFNIDRFSFKDGLPSWVHIQYLSEEIPSLANLTLLDANGKPIGFFANYETRWAPSSSLLEAEQSVIKDWFYQVTWVKSEITASAKKLLGNWLVIGNENELADQIIDLVNSPLCTWKKLDYAFNENDLISANGVVFIGCGSSQDEGLQINEKLFYLMQYAAKSSQISSLLVVTKGAEALDQRPLSLWQSLLSGLTKTLILEMPLIKCWQLDLYPSSSPQTQAQQIIEELTHDTSVDQVAYRNHERYIAQLQRISPKEHLKTPVTIRPNASYLITGGLGGLGLQIANWLSLQGAKHIVLISRRIPDKPILEIEKIRERGTSIEIASVDVSKFNQVEDLFKKFKEKWPELKGIIHAAGIFSDGTFENLKWNNFTAVYAAKVFGGWNLHQASLSENLDFFIFFSSIASIIGNVGQANYCSANAFLDALAFYRQQINLPALSISWGSWSEVGMAADLTERHARQGVLPIHPTEGIIAFKQVLGCSIPHLMIAPIDWQKLRIKENSSFFAKLKKQTHVQEKAKILNVLNVAESKNRHADLKSYLKSVVLDILGITGREIADDLPITELGMDSLMAIEIRNKLQNDLGGKFPASFALTYPTIQLLSDEILKFIKFEEGKEEKPREPIECLETRVQLEKQWQPLTKWTKLSDRHMTGWALLPFASSQFIGTGLHLTHLNIDILKEAYSSTLEQYPILSVAISRWSPKYRIPKIRSPEIFVIDLSDYPPESQQELILTKIREYSHTTPTWARISFALVFKLSSSHFHLRFFLIHFFDGYSMLKIFTEIMANYNALCLGKKRLVTPELSFFADQHKPRDLNEGIARKISELEKFWEKKSVFYDLSKGFIDLKSQRCSVERLILNAETTKLLNLQCVQQKLSAIQVIGLFVNFALQLFSEKKDAVYRVVHSLRSDADQELEAFVSVKFFCIDQNDSMNISDYANLTNNSKNILDMSNYPFLFAYPKMPRYNKWSTYKYALYFKWLLPSFPWKDYFVTYISQIGGGVKYLEKTQTHTFPLSLQVNPLIYDIDQPDDPFLMTAHFFAKNFGQKIWANNLLILKKEQNFILHYESIIKPEIQKLILAITEDLIKTFISPGGSHITLGEIKLRWIHKIRNCS